MRLLVCGALHAFEPAENLVFTHPLRKARNTIWQALRQKLRAALSMLQPAINHTKHRAGPKRKQEMEK
jgi:hypothetical protein